MEKGELNNYLEYVRKSIKELDAQIYVLDGGNWNKNIRGDYDKEMLYSALQNIRTNFRNLLRREFECEHMDQNEPISEKKEYYAFGKPIPMNFINELLNDGIPEEKITTEFLETLLEYERRDQQ